MPVIWESVFAKLIFQITDSAVSFGNGAFVVLGYGLCAAVPGGSFVENNPTTITTSPCGCNIPATQGLDS